MRALCGLLDVALAGLLWTTNEQQLCNPDPADIYSHYTGFRAYSRISYGWPILYHWHVIECQRGRITNEEFIPSTRDGDFPWTSQICFPNEKCFVAVRRKQYAGRKLPIYRADKRIGGLFECTNDEVEPVDPLYAVSQSLSFSYQHWFRRVRYVPLWLSQEPTSLYEKWEQELDLEEKYEYSAVDKTKPWYIANQAVNAMSHIRFEEGIMPWEFDALEKALNKTDSGD